MDGGLFPVNLGDGLKKISLGKPDRLIEVAEGCTPYGLPPPMEYSHDVSQIALGCQFLGISFPD